MNEFDPYGAVTHKVINQPQDLFDYNLFSTDIALQEAIKREGAAWACDDLERFGAELGKADYLALGQLANKHLPEFDTHDHHGHRIDLVRFHPAYHALMQKAISEGLHASPWRHPQAGAHVARAARFYMQSQVEAGHGCPITMTFAAIPCLQAQPDLAAQWLPKIMSLEYDPRNIPAAQKKGLTIGMAMTEKQGGSDVRANTTRAVPVDTGGAGQAYELVGHKYFVSAPMSDAFLVLAQAPGGLSCFLLPRWRPDGSKNPLQIQRLKKKMGNVSNASSETELRGALAWMVGKEGRGIATIIEMVAMTRFDCMVGSSAGMRAALNQALYHCSQRKTFGTLLTEQPLMQNVLADLALESEAALALTMRMARAIDNRAQASEELLLRLGTAIGKYWICKRTPQHAYEAMECIGGSGVMEDTVMPRLYREAPINAIWEGSGNVQCLDVLRAIAKTPEVLPAYFAELDSAKGRHAAFDHYVAQLTSDMQDVAELEYRARDLVDRMALALQATQLLKSAPAFVADAFCQSRLASQGHHQYGALPRHIDVKSIIDRAMPK
ncbi:isovaleryl-CoA dehydrogenase [Undibacterium sp. Jales W-56]|uniref:isovaleryl-CoA dehydrogenase n=1 Tax=Undibacterium sp. Jales W-56 TaxID=2897325 RepID=UPI0021D1D77D|nr:isovaleryl-CoA dehydrogenase [Undibacterium sp. Jales W-56]MCU6433298.1 isovaleryl-CoA dehydrogenase [Undibacterium sp. Jales W-56]